MFDCTFHNTAPLNGNNRRVTSSLKQGSSIIAAPAAMAPVSYSPSFKLCICCGPLKMGNTRECFQVSGKSREVRHVLAMWRRMGPTASKQRSGMRITPTRTLSPPFSASHIPLTGVRLGSPAEGGGGTAGGAGSLRAGLGRTLHGRRLEIGRLRAGQGRQNGHQVPPADGRQKRRRYAMERTVKAQLEASELR